MSHENLEKAIKSTLNKEITNKEASKLANISLAQFNRYKRDYINGDFSTSHKGLGNKNATKYTEERKTHMITTYLTESSKIVELSNGRRKARKISVFLKNYNYNNKTNISYGTAKQILYNEGIISPASRFKEKRLGNIPLIDSTKNTPAGYEFQTDGSCSYKFPDDDFYVVAHVIVDEATSALVGLYFEKGETNEGYINVFRQAFINVGVPLFTVSDGRTTFFNVNNPKELTLVGKILLKFGIEHITTKNCNRNNKVENAHGPIRDYIYDQMLFDGIKTYKEANREIDKYISHYNKMLNHVIPDVNALRYFPIEQIEEMFLISKYRTMDKKYTIQINNTKYFIVRENRLFQRKSGTKIEILTTYENEMFAKYGGNRYELVVANKEILSNLVYTRYDVIKSRVRKNGYSFKFNDELYYAVDSIGNAIKLQRRDVVSLNTLEGKLVKARTSKGIYLVRVGMPNVDSIIYTSVNRKINYKQIIDYKGKQYVLLDGLHNRSFSHVGQEVQILLRNKIPFSAMIDGKTYILFDVEKEPGKYKIPSSHYQARKLFGEILYK